MPTVGSLRIDITGNSAQFVSELAKASSATGDFQVRVQESMRGASSEAKATEALFKDAFGVAIPRHLRTAIAGVPGIGSLLAAAFAPTAALVLVDVLGNVHEKIVSAAQSMGGFTAEVKKSYEEAVRLNTELLKSMPTLGGAKSALAATNSALAALEARRKEVENRPLQGDDSAVLESISRARELRSIDDEVLRLTNLQAGQIAHVGELEKKAHDDAAEAAKRHNDELKHLAEQGATQAQRAIESMRQTANEFRTKALDPTSEALEKERQALAKVAELMGASGGGLASPAHLQASVAYLAVIQGTRRELEKAGEAEAKLVTETMKLIGEMAKQNLSQLQLALPRSALPSLNVDFAATALERLKADGQAQAEVMKRVFESAQTPAQQMKQALDELNISFENGKKAPELYAQGLKQIKQQFDLNAQSIQAFGQSVGQNIEQALLYGRSWGDVLKSVLVDLIRLTLQMTVFNRLASISPGGKLGGFFGSLLSGLTGHAGGGQMGAGEVGIVGERGPELWVPNSAGSVVPAGSFGVGGITVTNNYAIDARGAAPGVEANIRRALKDSEDRSVARSVRAVHEIQRRR